MRANKILWDEAGHAIRPDEISSCIDHFGESYNNAVKKIITISTTLDDAGEVFIECASLILANFGMSRRGPFHLVPRERLLDCWGEVGTQVVQINRSVLESGLPRGRYLLELDAIQQQELIAHVWHLAKRLLPFTMGKTSYGLVAATKILFSVLPEIVLPIDNTQWLQVFKTVDLGDVLAYMISDIQKWEASTRVRLDEIDHSRRLTTLPAVYNVMAMHARPATKNPPENSLTW